MYLNQNAGLSSCLPSSAEFSASLSRLLDIQRMIPAPVTGSHNEQIINWQDPSCSRYKYSNGSAIPLAVEGFVQTTEGQTVLLVPPDSLTLKVPPKTPAFFNPAAKLNRDLSITAYRAFLSSLKSRTFADGFAGACGALISAL